MRARNGAKHCDQHVQPRAGGDGVAQQRDSRVAAGQRLAHDAGAHDDGEQQGGAEEFGGDLLYRALRG